MNCAVLWWLSKYLYWADVFLSSMEHTGENIARVVRRLHDPIVGRRMPDRRTFLKKRRVFDDPVEVTLSEVLEPYLNKPIASMPAGMPPEKEIYRSLCASEGAMRAGIELSEMKLCLKEEHPHLHDEPYAELVSELRQKQYEHSIVKKTLSILEHEFPYLKE